MANPCRDLLDQVEPKDLTQIALQMLFTIERMELIIPEITDTIRKALEQDRPTPQPVAHVDVGIEWRPCVKLPITVHVREQRPSETHISTREGITPLLSDDLIMLGVQGEEYPIGRELFEQTYRLNDSESQPPAPGEVAELVGATWCVVDDPSYKKYDRTADLLQCQLQRQHPQPVAVSERLPGQEDCTAEGRCWLHYTNVCNITHWSLILKSAILDGPYTHWLPHYALPTPEAKP